MRKLLLLLLVISSYNTNAQTIDAWARLVNWDGISPYQQYIIYAPKYLGPNALPIPEIGQTKIDSTNNVTVAGVLHFSKGDHTQNPSLSANYCLLKNLVSFDINWIPIEWYNLSEEIKQERHVHPWFYDNKSIKGDMILNMNIQVLKKWEQYVHLAFRIGYRFPTSVVGAARFTDAPGYYFDISGSRQLRNPNFKLLAMAGFYAWQVEKAKQDDAMLFGLALQYQKNNCSFSFGSRGYLGYIRNGDHPILVYSSLEKKFGSMALEASLQKGIQDYPYSSIEVGAKYFFAKKSKP
jgi:hypothetical protein